MILGSSASREAVFIHFRRLDLQRQAPEGPQAAGSPRRVWKPASMGYDRGAPAAVRNADYPIRDGACAASCRSERHPSAILLDHPRDGERGTDIGRYVECDTKNFLFARFRVQRWARVVRKGDGRLVTRKPDAATNSDRVQQRSQKKIQTACIIQSI